VPYRFDTLGWVHEESHRVTLVGIDGTKTHLTDPIGRFRSPVPDGDRIVFLADGDVVAEMVDPTPESILDEMKHMGS